jgi:hypothetical protein
MADLGGLLWTEPDWLQEAGNWIKQELYRQELEPLGPIEQLRVRHWSTILRIPTSVGQIYFKAVIPELAYEAALTQMLSAQYPDWLPQVLAIAKAPGWLLLQDGGRQLWETLKTEADIQHWQQILPLYAKLQQDSAQSVNDYLALGVPDRRLATLPAQFQQLLTDTETLALAHPDGLSLSEYQRLQNSVDLLAQRCEQLAAFNLPATLHHGDLHAGNVFLKHSHYRIFDWGDSSISHPFFSLHSVYGTLERNFKLEKNSSWHKRLRECYLETWIDKATHSHATQSSLETAFALAQQLSPLLAVLRWLPVLANMDRAHRHRYIAAVPELLKEFLTLSQIS